VDRDSVANVQELGSIPTARLERKIGRIPANVMASLKAALAFILDLQLPSDRM
jgi:mRNA interferase MazF